MKKAAAIKDNNGQINAVYFLDSDKDIVSKETTFARDEWNRGLVKWEWDVEISKELGAEYQVIGNEIEDLGSGLLYRVFFVKKDKFTRRSTNEIIEEYIKEWESEVDEKEESNEATRN